MEAEVAAAEVTSTAFRPPGKPGAASGRPDVAGSGRRQREPAAATGLQATGTALSFAANRLIYGEGDDAGAFYRVLSGVVRTYRILHDGRRQIDAFHGAGDVFGFDPLAGRRLSAEAVCDAVVIAYGRQGLEPGAAVNTKLLAQLFACAVASLIRSQEHSVLLGRRNAIEKVAAFLVDLANHAPRGAIITLAMSREDMADYLGMRVETISRTLAEMVRQALIELQTAREFRIIDPRGLRDLAA
jgi:CRP/FNR family nitrogen fixation transcriptional regulator